MTGASLAVVGVMLQDALKNKRPAGLVTIAIGSPIALVLHDLNQAARYADRMVGLKQGAIVADGAAHNIS